MERKSSFQIPAFVLVSLLFLWKEQAVSCPQIPYWAEIAGVNTICVQQKQKQIFSLEGDQTPGLFSFIWNKKLPLAAVGRLSDTLTQQRLSWHINALRSNRESASAEVLISVPVSASHQRQSRMERRWTQRVSDRVESWCGHYDQTGPGNVRWMGPTPNLLHSYRSVRMLPLSYVNIFRMWYDRRPWRLH